MDNAVVKFLVKFNMMLKSSMTFIGEFKEDDLFIVFSFDNDRSGLCA